MMNLSVRQPCLVLFLLLLFFISGCSGSGRNAVHDENAGQGSIASPEQLPVKKGPDLMDMLDQVSCSQSDDLRGAGVGMNDGVALSEARSQISLQVEARLSSVTESEKQQQVINGNENLRSWWRSQIQQTTHLINAQDARPIQTFRYGDRVGVVACMSRAAAAAPIQNQLRVLSDSLSTAVASELFQEHPLRKQDAWKTAQSLYIRFLAVRHVVEGLIGSAVAPTDSVEAEYRRMVEDYQKFRSSYAFFWNLQAGNGPAVIFAGLSSRYKVETGECLQGLRLTLEAEEPTCGENALGIQCSYQPALRGSSCSGETYFLLQTPAVRGIGRYDEQEARQRMWDKLKVAPFWNDWFAELDKWRLE